MDKTKKWSEILLDYALYLILGIMIIGVVIADSSFLSLNNMWKILSQASTRGILALGVAGMIVLAGTDLSAGRILGCGAAVSASLLQSVTYASRMYPQITEPLPMILPLLLSIVVCVAFCLLNGFGVAKLHMHAFIISLGTQLIAYGVLCLYIDSQKDGAQPLASLDPRYISLVNGKFWGVPNLVWFLILCAIVMWIIWNKTTLGKNMFAIGGNTEAAAVSGVNVAKNIMMVYLVAGVLYGIASFLEAGRIQSVTTSTGLNYDLDAISGCVIGGVSFSGGVGTIPGVLIGVIILQVINYSLYYLGVNAYLQYVIKGLIIILAVAIDVRKYIAKK
ncbi:galactose/methyl galactoside ABC transporter permease MglC [Anaerotignum sp. MB30-C6]|uniref:galactose/methyl galactoside ABC transporter permease MglC n=1 Tax=Anaerotignum sp. MB30-C6 TaxID=3070814 RepID=UPI0027DB820A|nr:galactose/methyl galactoside ABC transporter permease MglC [Anaerotignum sp. MB30-C6]WMI80989.1 galactose/methyl galactoside ABC transporter permease MglC [Anaerotignum sp. MB30-C6]